MNTEQPTTVENAEAKPGCAPATGSALVDAVRAAVPLLRHYENQLASSLSCDSRSHDNDRESRQQLNSILDAVEIEAKKFERVIKALEFIAFNNTGCWKDKDRRERARDTLVDIGTHCHLDRNGKPDTTRESAWLRKVLDDAKAAKAQWPEWAKGEAQNDQADRPAGLNSTNV